MGSIRRRRLCSAAIRPAPQKPLVYGACFHAQQCAEKYLKALLIAKKQPFPKTHDLRLLSNLCTQAGIWVEPDRDQLDLLSLYAVRARYPGDAPTVDDAREALKITQAVRRFARKWLGLT